MNIFKKLFNKKETKENITTELSVVVSKEEQLKIDYPYVVSGYAVNNAAQNIIMKYNLIENVNYVKIEEAHTSFGYTPFHQYSRIRFKDKAIVDEIGNLAERQIALANMFETYDEFIKFNYYSEIFKAKNKLTKSISFLPKNNCLDKVLATLIKFYVKNNYDLPDIDTFKSGMLVCNKGSQKFTIFVRDESEAGQLILEISEFIEIID